MSLEGERPKPRTRLYAGDVLFQNSARSKFPLIIESSYPKSGWQARVNEPHQAVFPGSTIDFEGRLYEVVRLIEPRSGSSRFRYCLKPWEDRFPIRVKFSYSREGVRKELRDRQLENYTQLDRFLLYLMMPLIGMLPERDQSQIQNKYGVSAVRMTLVSALFLLILGGAGLLFRMIEIFGGTVPGPSSLQFLFSFGPYFFCESLVRLYSALTQEQPIGSLPVWLVLETYRAVRRELDPRYQRERLERLDGSGKLYETMQDEIRNRNENELEIISALPKPHWTPVTGIVYNDVWYGLIDSSIKRGESPNAQRHHFILRRAPDGTVFRTTCSYSPDEIQFEYHKKRKQNMSTWVDTFSMLWGLLDREDQERLQRTYGFDAMKYTKWTIVVLGLTGILNLIASIANYYGKIAKAPDLLWAIASIYLVIESYRRWKKWKVGHPSGSVLGILLKPLASPLLRIR